MKYLTFLLFFLSLAFNLYYQRLQHLNSDESDLLLPAIRILRGEVPYRDFFQFRTPGSFYFMALWFKIFGVSWTSIRLASALEGATIVTLLYVLAKRIINSSYLPLLAPILSLPFCIVL